MKTSIPIILGATLLFAGVSLAFAVNSPTLIQARVMMVLVALGGGGVAAGIPGLFKLDIKFSRSVAIGSAGALGVFVLLFFFDPLHAINHSSTNNEIATPDEGRNVIRSGSGSVNTIVDNNSQAVVAPAGGSLSD